MLSETDTQVGRQAGMRQGALHGGLRGGTPTVLIQHLDAGAPGQQLLNGLLQSAPGRQVEGTEREASTRREGFPMSLFETREKTYRYGQRALASRGGTHVCNAAFVALMRAESVSFSRMNNAQSSFPWGRGERWLRFHFSHLGGCPLKQLESG